MIRILFISLLFIFSKSSTVQTNNTERGIHPKQVQTAQKESLLAGIQNKIYYAFVESLKTHNDSLLTDIGIELKSLYNKRHQKLILYWRSYLQFYLSVYYMKIGNKIAAEKDIDKGVEWLKGMQNKNSEDYALLAYLQEYQIQFKGMEAMFISREIVKNAETAIAMDPNNLRAYYVYASNDFYTPKEYGGGRSAKKYLLKALSLPSQKIRNEYLPSWGKAESYVLLVRLYIKQKQWKLAKKYFQQALKKYPKNYSIQSLASYFVKSK